MTSSDTGEQINVHLPSSSSTLPVFQNHQPPAQKVSSFRIVSSRSTSPEGQRHQVGVENVISYMPPEPPTSAESKEYGAVARRNQETRALVAELNDTIGKKAGQALRRKESRAPGVLIHEKSTPEEVSLWLQEKGFSARVIELLEGQDGANMFALNRASLIQACGREEGKRLYSQLLVQKQQSNYRTHSSAELNAILNYRKMHVDVTNEAPVDEPATSVTK